jgi:tetratricopeptide (TPR) repeat protein
LPPQLEIPAKGRYNMPMGINRVGNIYFGALERFGCMLLMLISVGCASLFALWATFLYQPSNSMAYDAPAAVTLTTPDDIVFDAPPASATPGLPPSPTVIPTSTSTPNPAPSPTSTPIPTYTPTPAPTATPTPQPILPPPIDSPPGQAFLASMNHEYQKLNNCGPVSLAAAASFFGAEVTQFDAADVVKGSPEDRNVSPQEMVDYLRSLGLGAVYRVNGNEELMKQLLANDLPVIVHQWLVRPHDGVLVGHYRVLRGYDAGQGYFVANDPYTGPQLTIPYAQFEEWWRPFNRGYIPVYRPEQEALVAAILGEDWDEETNHHRALAQAEVETQSFADGYAFFNLADEYLALGNLTAAVEAFDTAFAFEFPDHFLWYQFGPLEAFNQVGRYQQVLDITNTVIANAGELEEARLQRGVAYLGLGDPVAARAEIEKALAANPRYERAAVALQSLE